MPLAAGNIPTDNPIDPEPAMDKSEAIVADVPVTSTEATTPVKKTFKEKSWSERLGYNWYHDGQFVHSWFIQDPRIVFAIRLLLSCWLLGVWIAQWVTSTAPTYVLTYFTILSYTGLMFSEMTLTLMSYFRMTRGPKAAEGRATPLHPWTFVPDNKFLRGLIYTVSPPQVSIHMVVVIVSSISR
jgi:hypothetical protein